MKDRVETILKGIARNQRVANAYIFSGGEAEAKYSSAVAFAESLNGRPSETDVITIKPEEDSTSLKIEQIRELKDLTRYGPSQNPYQVVILKEADSLTAQAANGFLKLLEEPPPQVVFILIVNREESLPATILSRCQRVIFPESPSLIDDASRQIFASLNKKPFDLISNSQLLLEKAGPDGKLEELLTELFCLYAEAGDHKKARPVFETLKFVKKRGNQKLAADHLGMRLWKEN